MNTPTCKYPDLHLFINEVDGFEFNTSLASSLGVLPGYIPTFDYSSRNLRNINAKHYPVVSVTLHDILSSGVSTTAGMLHERDIKFRPTF